MVQDEVGTRAADALGRPGGGDGDGPPEGAIPEVEADVEHHPVDEVEVQERPARVAPGSASTVLMPWSASVASAAVRSNLPSSPAGVPTTSTPASSSAARREGSTSGPHSTNVPGRATAASAGVRSRESSTTGRGGRATSTP
jgi:hypothetical protein